MNGGLTPSQRGVTPKQLGLAPSDQPGFVRKPYGSGIARKKSGRSEKNKLYYEKNAEDIKKKRNTPEAKASIKQYQREYRQRTKKQRVEALSSGMPSNSRTRQQRFCGSKRLRG